MAHTYRAVPNGKSMRTPRYRWKLLDGVSRKHIVDDWADKPVAALKEVHGNARNFASRFPGGYRERGTL